MKGSCTKAEIPAGIFSNIAKDHILSHALLLSVCIAENAVLLLMLPLFYLQLLKVRSPITCTHSFLSLDSLRYTLCQTQEEYLPHAAYLPYTSIGKR